MKKIILFLAAIVIGSSSLFSAYDESVVLGRASTTITTSSDYLQYIRGTGPNDVIWSVVFNSTNTGMPTIGFYDSRSSHTAFISSFTGSGGISRDIQIGIRVSSGITYSIKGNSTPYGLTIIYKKTGR